LQTPRRLTAWITSLSTRLPCGVSIARQNQAVEWLEHQFFTFLNEVEDLVAEYKKPSVIQMSECWLDFILHQAYASNSARWKLVDAGIEMKQPIFRSLRTVMSDNGASVSLSL
jgi:hypothetical protein